MPNKPSYEELEQRILELEHTKKEKERVFDKLKTERKLIDSEKKHKALIENLSDLIIILDKNGINVWNSPSVRQYGIKPEDAIGRPFDEFVHPDDLGRVRELWNKVIANPGKNFIEEHRVTGTPENPGTWIYQQNTLVYLPDVPGINGVVAVCRNITNQKLAEAALLENQSKLLLAQYIAKMGDFTWEIASGNATWSEGMYKLLKYDLIEKMDYSKVNSAIHHPDDLESVTKWLNDSIVSGEENITPKEYRLVCKDGEIIYVHTEGRIEYKDGKAIKLFGTCQNITNRKQTELALLNEKNFIDMVIDSLPGIFYLFSKEGKMLRWNKNFEKFSGYTTVEIREMHPRDFFPVEEQTIVEERILDVFTNGESFVEANWLSKDKTKTLYYLTGVRVDIEGRLCLVGMGININDRKRADEEHKKFQDQLQQSQKMEAIGTLAGGIAHDFNNMLGIILGNISNALSNLGKNDKLYEILSEVQNATKQAKTLTHQLLTFSKGGAPIKKTVNINKLIGESAIFSIRGSNTKCNFKFSNDLWSSKVDEGQINQVVSNLVINANQAMPNGGTITIQTENVEIKKDIDPPLSKGKYIKIVFKDQGIGITKEHLLNIFEPFFTTKPKGSGLGLATTYSIIKRHDGHITVHSEIGTGTVFSVYLPASSKKIEECINVEKTKHIGHGKILVLDDQEAILKMVGIMLKLLGYETGFAMDGYEAIEKYRKAYEDKKPYNLVILDLTVPGGMGGLQVIVELLKIDPDIKAVVSSGYSDDPIMANYKDYGFCGIVPKPYTKEQLSEVLSKIFDKKN